MKREFHIIMHLIGVNLEKLHFDGNLDIRDTISNKELKEKISNSSQMFEQKLHLYLIQIQVCRANMLLIKSNLVFLFLHFLLTSYSKTKEDK